MEKLLLREKEIHAGMTVVPCFEDGERPPGKPLILKALLGGVPTRMKFYRADKSGDLVVRRDRQGGIKISGGYENFNPKVRFIPILQFSSTKAPNNTRFVVFIDNKRLKYEKRDDEYVYIFKDSKGYCRSCNGYMSDYWMCIYPLLPESALLIPVSGIGKKIEGEGGIPFIFSPAEAPAKTGYIIHHNGQHLKYPGTDEKIKIFKDEGGWFISNRWSEVKKWGPNYPFPENAELIARTPIGKGDVDEFLCRIPMDLD